jgi:hypothetical protein
MAAAAAPARVQAVRRFMMMPSVECQCRYAGGIAWSCGALPSFGSFSAASFTVSGFADEAVREACTVFNGVVSALVAAFAVRLVAGEARVVVSALSEGLTCPLVATLRTGFVLVGLESECLQRVCELVTVEPRGQQFADDCFLSVEDRL